MQEQKRKAALYNFPVFMHLCGGTVLGMRRSQGGCTADSENQMAEQSVMRQTTETEPDPEDLKGRRRRGGRG